MADITIPPATVVPSANATLVHGRKAASAIVAGQTVYILVDGRIAPADANGAAPLFNIAGLAANSASAGQPCSYITDDPALDLGPTTPAIAAGDTLIASATPGGVAPDADCASGWYKTILGIGIGSNKVAFKLLPAGVVK